MVREVKRRFKQGMFQRMSWSARLVAIERLSPRLRRLRFQSDALVGASWTPGDKVKVQVAEGVLRSYTPARLDAAAGWMDVVFFLHGSGPGSALAVDIQVGQEVRFVGPVSSMAGREAPEWAVFLGDESAAGLAQALLEALPEGTPTYGAIELAEADAPALGAMGLELQAAARVHDRGAALAGWLDDFEPPAGEGVYWLSGHAATARALKAQLEARGVPVDSVCMKAYWGDKRR